MYDRQKSFIAKMGCAMLGCDWRFIWASRTDTYSYVQCRRCGEVGWKVKRGEA